MTSTVKTLTDRGLITPPTFLAGNIHYETIMGSVAYGVSNDNSDMDVYGMVIPPIDVIFPHHAGVVLGYDKNYHKFEQYQQHHIEDKSSKKEYDLSIYNIVKYFRLCADCNPNMVDSLFTDRTCVLHCTPIGNMLREENKLFLSKKCYHTFKGYAYAQMSKMRSGTNKNNPKRQAMIQKHGYDLKFAYHLVRLLNECEMILKEGELDLRVNREQLKSIRRGEWTLEEVEEYFVHKEKLLEELYIKSNAVPDKVREVEVKQLLINCLEHHYGSLDKVLHNENKDSALLQKIRELVK